MALLLAPREPRQMVPMAEGSITLFVTVAVLIVLKLIQMLIAAYDTSTGPYQTADGHWSAHPVAGPTATEDDQAYVSCEQEPDRLRLRPAQPPRPASLPTPSYAEPSLKRKLRRP